jgi:predicted lipoprotein with Yx(FWY)xxD motif
MVTAPPRRGQTVGGVMPGRLRAAALALALLLGATGCASGTRAAPPTTPPPATVTLLTAKASFGTYLTDGAGRALYMWDADREGSSTCYGDCAVAWPPLTVGDAAEAGPGVDASLIGTVARSDGTQQVTYGGWPLYHFETDLQPGELSGQGDTGFGAVWWVVSPDGEPLPSS